jgi:TfoX/Sxy family transcriptional regulator of competence genes
MSPMSRGSMPKPSEEAITAFRAVVPDHPAVTMRPMFGNLAAFVNGNMFSGLFGEDLFVRLSESDLSRLMSEGGGPFEPMPGRGMKGYATLPKGWGGRKPATTEWIARSLTWAQTLPAKEAKKTRARG